MNFAVSLFSFFACIIVAKLLGKAKAFDFQKNRTTRFETLDGLRGFLAISVVIHHFTITYYWKISGKWERPPEDFYQNYGKVGVAIFFMITGFLFISKITRPQADIDWSKLFESRLFRIIPLYIFAVLSITLIVFIESDFHLKSSTPELLKQYMKWALFKGGPINNYEDTRLIIAGVDWTLKYEWLFYASLPFLYLLLHRAGRIGVFFIYILIIIYFLKPIAFGAFSTEFFIFFAVGGGASYIATQKIISSKIIKSNFASALGLATFLFTIFYPNTFNPAHVTLISIFFILVVLGNDLFGILTMKSAMLLGEISFSIYLLHGLILYILFTTFPIVNIATLTPTQYSLFMPIICMLVVAISSTTFLLIEKPFIAQGQRYLLTKLLIFYVSKFHKSSKHKINN